MPIRHIIFLCLLVLLSIAFGDPVSAMTNPVHEPESVIKQVIQKKIGRFYEKFQSDMTNEELTDATNRLVKDLGFNSVEELAAVKVGQRFPIYHIELVQLRTFRPGEDDPKTILSETDSFIYPLLVPVDGQLKLRSSATVSIIPDKENQKTIVHLTQLGSPILTQLLDQGREDLLEPSTRQCKKCFVVSVPSLSRTFVGDENQGQLRIRVLENGPGNLILGDLRPASRVFAELSE